MSTTFRKTAALVWTQDPAPVMLRRASAVALASDTGLALRSIQGYAFETVPPALNLRNIQGYAFESVNTALPVNVTGDVALYNLINNNRKVSMTFSSSNTTLGTSTALAQPDANGHNTSVSLTANASSGYGGSMTFYYLRRPMSDLGPASISLGTIAANTTIHAMLATINSKYSWNLTANDVLDGVVKAGDVSITLTAAAGAYLFVPGTQTVVGIHQALSTALVTTALSGFDHA